MTSRTPIQDVLDAAPALRALHRRAGCVFFDCDGVIFDSNGFKIVAMRQALAGHTEEQLAAMEAHWRANGGVSRFIKFEHFFTNIAPSADVPTAVEAAAERFGRLSRAAYENASPIAPALDLARATGAERCHVVSGATHVEMESVFSSKGIAPLFASIQGSPRPKRELVEGVLRARGCAPADALLIGDGSMDHRVCRELGIHFVYLAEFSDWTGARAALGAATGVSIARSWADLTRALLG